MTKHSEKKLSLGIIITHIILVLECMLFINNYPNGFFSNPTSLMTKLFWVLLMTFIGMLLVYTI